MNINKTMISALLAVSAFGLTASMSASALNADAEAACPGCHGVVINSIQAVGSGGRNCSQRSVSSWLSTISKMKGKGCKVVAGTEQGIADYLACVGNPACTTTTTTATTASTTATTDTTTATTGTVTATTDTTTATTASTTATTASTTASTTATTVPGCNTYVNGTTQYKYSGKGICHGYGDDRTGPHIVHVEDWCKKHKDHFNSAGSHAHAPVHPTCM